MKTIDQRKGRPKRSSGPQWATRLFGPVFGLLLVISLTTNAADFRNGAKVYAENCERCHGTSGEGVAGIGDLTERYQLMKPDEVLFEVIRDGVSAMPGYDSLLTSDEVLDVIAYMRTFQ